MYEEKKLKDECVFKGRVFEVHVAQVQLPDGREARRDLVLHHGGACVIPVDADGQVCLVEQYRIATAQTLLEVPAGKLEAGENPLDCARRELAEETGYTAGRIISLGSCWTSPGFSSERLYLYLALDLKKGRQHLDEGEFLSCRVIPLSEAVGMVLDGTICDAKSQIAILKAKQYLSAEQKPAGCQGAANEQ
ncbi:NUDIX hydrolase [Oscillospiraceae bacterium HV4-5-C5C]|nr:NUDIX hydrolase [Oscillospiraceae bacterium HV4-5-C5C]